jgi:hypothetical protein
LSIAGLTLLLLQVHTQDIGLIFSDDTQQTTSIVIPEEYVTSRAPDVIIDETPKPSTDPRANATMLMLARNSDINGVLQSVREAEDRFNRVYKYPWVFLNDEEFTEDFKSCVCVMHILH